MSHQKLTLSKITIFEQLSKMYGFVESKITSKYAPLKTKKFTKFRAEQLDDYKKVTSENTI